MNSKLAIKESEPKVPTALNKALASSPKAKVQWVNLTPIARRDFVTWIESAKMKETYTGRILKAKDMLASGKKRPCCYSVIPLDLYKILSTNPKAKAQWKSISPGEKRDFASWVDSEKDLARRAKRIQQVCDMLAAGRRRP